MNQRINITLPEQTVKLLNRTAKRGDRSKMIDAAIRNYVIEQGRGRLADRLEESYRAGGVEDLTLAAEWFAAEASGDQ